MKPHDATHYLPTTGYTMPRRYYKKANGDWLVWNRLNENHSYTWWFTDIDANRLTKLESNK